MSSLSFDRLRISKPTLEVEHELFDAVRCSPNLGLKALDALHLDYARTTKELAPSLDSDSLKLSLS